MDKHFLFFSVANKVYKINNNKKLIEGYNLLSTLEKGAIKTLEQKKFLVNQIVIKENLDRLFFFINLFDF